MSGNSISGCLRSIYNGYPVIPTYQHRIYLFQCGNYLFAFRIGIFYPCTSYNAVEAFCLDNPLKRAIAFNSSFGRPEYCQLKPAHPAYQNKANSSELSIVRDALFCTLYVLSSRLLIGIRIQRTNSDSNFPKRTPTGVKYSECIEWKAKVLYTIHNLHKLI